MQHISHINVGNFVVSLSWRLVRLRLLLRGQSRTFKYVHASQVHLIDDDDFGSVLFGGSGVGVGVDLLVEAFAAIVMESLLLFLLRVICSFSPLDDNDFFRPPDDDEGGLYDDEEKDGRVEEDIRSRFSSGNR